MTLWFKDITREGTKIICKVLSLNLTVCWNILRAFGTKLILGWGVSLIHT
jgi:hypothetical protein